eukprot:TRINITY_DN5210_c0_g1_i2.p3 TRINITY_DN5210_c0_g1~~TRINITY_DN5210_c0_g1_i2.p3  ORF type:complete len:304 (-),score=88.80 TRINITY_DN5210_c0_g1_i2:1007-1918(-)
MDSGRVKYGQWPSGNQDELIDGKGRAVGQGPQQRKRRECMADFHVFKSNAEVVEAAARLFTELSHRALEERGRFTVALCGEATPAPLFQLLASSPWQDAVPWDRTVFFWSDDRAVGPEDERSNFKAARLILLDNVPVREENVIRIRGELGAEKGAQGLRNDLVEAFGENELPRFDLVLLGLGADGHTASLFPGDEALAGTQWAAPVFDPPADPAVDRITLTLDVLNNARTALFLVTGPDKQDVVAAVVNDPSADDRYPAARVEAAQTLWYVDEAAFARAGSTKQSSDNPYGLPIQNISPELDK